MEKIKIFLRSHKKVVIAVLTPVFLFFLAVVVIAAVKTFDAKKTRREFDRKAREVQAELERPYKEDVYGGKTPEETWSMFLDALRNGDVDLASKYFVVEKQGEEKKFLEKEKNLDNLQLVINQFSSELKKEKEYLQGEKAYFYYDLRDNKTNKIYSNSVVFYFNPYTEVWKILVL